MGSKLTSFFGLFKSEKPSIYLGSIVVADDSKRAKIEKFANPLGASLEDHMRQKLEEIFCLNNAATITEPKDSELGIDIVIVTLHGGDAFSVNLPGVGFPIFWRPKIKLVARLYRLKHNKTIKTFSVSQSVQWRDFLDQSLSLRSLLPFGNIYSNKDMEILLYKASYKLIEKMRKAI